MKITSLKTLPWMAWIKTLLWGGSYWMLLGILSLVVFVGSIKVAEMLLPGSASGVLFTLILPLLLAAVPVVLARGLVWVRGGLSSGMFWWVVLPLCYNISRVLGQLVFEAEMALRQGVSFRLLLGYINANYDIAFYGVAVQVLAMVVIVQLAHKRLGVEA